VDLADRVSSLLAAAPGVTRVDLVGSRATGRFRRESDWDFTLQTTDFDAVASALPDLLAPLEPLAEQWDRLSDEQCWMLILAGPVKVDLIFPGERHVHEPPWRPTAANLAGVDAHFWDWTLWLHAKATAGKSDVLVRELQKLFDHLLRPLGAARVPASVTEAVQLYRGARADLETRLEIVVSRRLEQEVAPVVAERSDR